MADTTSDTCRRSHPRKIDLSGQQFSKLTVIRQSGNRKSGESIWECRCECGNTAHVTSSKLRKGHTNSCGCNRGELHGHNFKNSPEYRAWNGMKRRCYWKKHKDYSRYGGRGIVVCERWMNSFTTFLEDMGLRPSSKHSLDRIDVNGNYEPSNCRWATDVEQSNNRHSNVVIEFNGESKTATEWARHLGMPDDVIAKRIRRGWSIERALTQPARRSHANS